MLILWDVDDVLNQLMDEWLGFWQNSQQFERRTTQIFQITKNPPNQILGISIEEYLESLDEFRNSKLGRDLSPNPKVLNWFEEFGDQYVHIALTARPKETMPTQAAWVYEHFGRWIHSVVSVNPSRPGLEYPVHSVFSNKASFVQWLDKPTVLIDDSEENIRKAKKHCRKVLLFPQPWNSCTQSVERVLIELNQILET